MSIGRTFLRGLALAAAVVVAAIVAGAAVALPPAGGCTIRTCPPDPPPKAPTGLTVYASTTSSISLRWQSYASAQTDDVQRKAGGSWLAVATLAATGSLMRYTDSGLAANNAYCYRIEARNDGGIAVTPPVCAVATSTAPAAATNLTATATGQTTMALAWTDNAANEESSTLQRRPQSSSSWTTLQTSSFSGTGARSATDSGLAPATGYCYRVTMANRFGEADTPDVCARTQSPPPPPAPTLNSVDAGQQTVNAPYTVFFDVTVTVTDETGYSLKLEGPSGQWTVAATWPANAVQTSGDWGSTGGTVSPSTSYCVVFTAKNQWGSSDSNQKCFTTPPTPPVAPSNLVVTATGQTSLGLSWQDNSTDETSFPVEYWALGTSSGGAFDAGAHAGTGAVTGSIGGLQPATTYCVIVAARKTVAGSAPVDSSGTNELCTATAAPAPPPAPTPRITGTTTSSVSLAWTEPAGASVDGFHVDWQNRSGGWMQVASIGAGTTSYTVTGLAPSTGYCYRVDAYDAGDSASSATVCGTTAAPPAQPNLVIRGIYLTEVADPTQIENNIAAGQPFSVTWDECNAGAANAAAHSDNLGVSGAVGRSSDAKSVQALVPGQCTLVSVDATHGLPEGEYTAVVTLDRGGNVAETSEADDVSEMFFSIG